MPGAASVTSAELEPAVHPVRSAAGVYWNERMTLPLTLRHVPSAGSVSMPFPQDKLL